MRNRLSRKGDYYNRALSRGQEYALLCSSSQSPQVVIRQGCSPLSKAYGISTAGPSKIGGTTSVIA